MSTIAPYAISEMTLKRDLIGESRSLYNKELKELSPYELNHVISCVVKDKIIAPNWESSMNLYSEERIAIYFSIEFLLGRIVLDVLNNTGIYAATREVLREEGINIRCLEEVDDTALGNGGLGRLAACFIESAVSMGYPLYGVGLTINMDSLSKVSIQKAVRSKNRMIGLLMVNRGLLLDATGLFLLSTLTQKCLQSLCLCLLLDIISIRNVAIVVSIRLCFGRLSPSLV